MTAYSYNPNMGPIQPRQLTPEDWTHINVAPQQQQQPQQQPGFNPGVMAQQPQIPGMQGGDVQPFQLPPAPQMPTGMSINPMMGGQGPAPQMSNDDYLRMLYQTQLGREGDQGGMDYWRQQMANGMDRNQIRQAFGQSQEGQDYYQRRAPMMDDFGRGNGLPPLSNREAIQQMYRDQLGREADQEGLNYWLGQIENGGLRQDQVNQAIGGGQEALDYRRNKPFDWTNVNARPQMPPEVSDALRIARQGQGTQTPPQGGSQQQNIGQALGLLRMLGVM